MRFSDFRNFSSGSPNAGKINTPSYLSFLMRIYLMLDNIFFKYMYIREVDGTQFVVSVLIRPLPNDGKGKKETHRQITLER